DLQVPEIMGATPGAGPANAGTTLRLRDRFLGLPKKFARSPRVRPTTRDVFGPLQTPLDRQDQLESQFFQRVVLPNGTFKTTTTHRRYDLTPAPLPFLARLPTPAQRQKIMDVGISPGVRTFEGHKQLTSQGLP